MSEYCKYLTSWLFYRLKGGTSLPSSPLRLELFKDFHLYSYKEYHRIKRFRTNWIKLIEADELDNISDIKYYNYKRFSIRYNQ